MGGAITYFVSKYFEEEVQQVFDAFEEKTGFSIFSYDEANSIVYTSKDTTIKTGFLQDSDQVDILTRFKQLEALLSKFESMETKVFGTIDAVTSKIKKDVQPQLINKFDTNNTEIKYHAVDINYPNLRFDKIVIVKNYGNFDPILPVEWASEVPKWFLGNVYIFGQVVVDGVINFQVVS